MQRFDNVTLSSCPLELKYTYNMDEHERQQVSVMFRGIFDRSVSMTLSDRYDMIILDEVFDVIHEGMLAGSAVFEFISNAPNSLEIVMTGRKPPQRFIDAADYVTEFKKIKHPFDHGVAARIGIEF